MENEHYMDFIYPKSTNPVRVMKQICENLQNEHPGKKIVVTPGFIIGFLEQLEGSEENKNDLIEHFSSMGEEETLTVSEVLSFLRSLNKKG